MATIVTRAGKGSGLTNAEVDANFLNLDAELGTMLPRSGGTLTGNLLISTGALGVNTTFLNNYLFRVGGNITGATTRGAAEINTTAQSDVTAEARGLVSTVSTAAASFTVGQTSAFFAAQGTIGAGSTVTTQVGYLVSSNFTGGTNNYGFRGAIPSGANRWNLYMDGTAANHLAGRLGIGSLVLNNENLRVGLGITGAVSVQSILVDGAVQSDATTRASYYRTVANTQAASFTLSNLYHFEATQNATFGAGSAVTTQVGFRADSTMTGASTNIGFRGAIPAGAGRWNLYMDGAASNFIGGNFMLAAPLGLGGPASPNYGTADQVLTSQGSAATPSWQGLKTVNGNNILGSGNIQIDGGVTSFNTRTGAVTLSSGDVTTALGFTPYNATNPTGFITNTGNARVGVENNGTLVGTRRNINFIPGTGISLSIADDSANEEVDVTITSTVTAPVQSVFGRTGAVTLTSSDVTTALGFTPQTSLVSGTNIRTINGASVLGSGDLTVSGTDPTKLPLSGGTLTTGASSNLFIGRNSTATNYNAISLNGNSADSSNMGLTGGGTGDSTLYINSPGSISIRTNSFGNAFSFSGANFSAPGQVSSGGNNGFANATWSSGVRNPIWYFGNATTYGISYFQGSSGRDGSDTIGLHPNGTATATGSSFAVNSSNAFVNNNIVLHAGNYTGYVPTSLNLSGHTISNSAWAGGGGYHGYTFNGGNFRFGFSSTGGVVDVYADGNFYATDSSHLVLHAGNYSGYSTFSGALTATYGLGRAAQNAIGCNIGTAVPTWNNSQLEIRNTDGGNVGISFHRSGYTVSALYHSGGSNLIATGDFTAGGNVTANSDERLKKDWAALASDFIERLATVKSGTYTRIDSDERQAGSSAQDWQALLPEVVQIGYDDEKTLSLAYGNAALVSAIELAKRVVEQEARIARLESLLHP